MEYLAMVAQFLIAKFPMLAAYGANALAVCMGVGLLIEGAEVVAALTASKKDDAAVAKIKAIKDKVIAVLEIIPHANIPVAPVILKVLAAVGKGVSVLKAAIGAFKA